MKIAVISHWFNEEKLAKLFLKNHNYADKIIIFIDNNSTDNTLKILSNIVNPKLEIRSYSMPEGLDDSLKASSINKAARECFGIYDWVFALDADEFINEDIYPILENCGEYTSFNLKMFNLYRHLSESDFNPDGECNQRQHGVTLGSKTCIAKPTPIIRWGVGSHCLDTPNKCSPRNIIGTHWNMADPYIALDRRITRKNNLSRTNKMKKWGYQNFDITEEKILKECKDHENDPKVV